MAERRQLIKNKILAVGKMSKMFSVLREESEAVSELKNVSGSNVLPPGQLATGVEGIRESIQTFGDARKSDIDNEHLPPDLVDPEDAEGVAALSSAEAETVEFDPFDSVPVPSSPISPGATSTTTASTSAMSTAPSSPVAASPGGGHRVTTSISDSPVSDSAPPSPTSPSSPTSPRENASARFKRGHARQSSLGTTRTSPSTRRRSLDKTIHMIREVMSRDDQKIEELAEKVAAGSESPRSPSSPRNSISHGSPSPLLPASPSPGGKSN